MSKTDLPAGLPQPAQRALRAAGIDSLEQLSELTEADALKLHGMGPKALSVLRPALAAHGLGFRPQP